MWLSLAFPKIKKIWRIRGQETNANILFQFLRAGAVIIIHFAMQLNTLRSERTWLINPYKS